MSWLTEMRNPIRIPAVFSGIVGTRNRLQPGYVHSGVDIAVPKGTPVYSAGPGTVVYAGYNRGSGYGNFVIIDHGNGIFSAYAHLDSVATIQDSSGTMRQLQAGDTVTSATNIGLSGQTVGDGTSAANDSNQYPPHLHFEIRHINGLVQTVVDSDGYQRPYVMVDAEGQTKSRWNTFGSDYQRALENPNGLGGQALYDPAQMLLYGAAALSESTAAVAPVLSAFDSSNQNGGIGTVVGSVFGSLNGVTNLTGAIRSGNPLSIATAATSVASSLGGVMQTLDPRGFDSAFAGLGDTALEGLSAGVAGLQIAGNVTGILRSGASVVQNSLQIARAVWMDGNAVNGC